MRTTVWAIGLVLASGCFSDPGGTGGFVTTSGTSTGGPTAPTSTGGDTSTSTSTSEAGSGSTATTREPTGSTTSTMGGEGDACDPWGQDCAEGLKCAPYAMNGGDAWDANRCTPAGEGVPGGPCIAMKSATSGYDTCEKGSLCWDVNPATLAGVCYALCKGSPSTPLCPPNSACSMVNEGAVNVCLGTCDPLQPKCGVGEVCVPDGADQFLCFADAAPRPLYDACEYLNECELGTMCTYASANSKCDQTALRCCTQFCDLVGEPCGDGLQCQPYFSMGKAPAGLENLGLCQDP